MPTLFIKGKLIEHPNSPKQSELDKHVPLEYIMGWMDERLNKPGTSMADRVMILESSTGSGKSTLIPAEFYHRYFTETDNRNICCTQPKILTTMQIPYQVIPYHTEEYLKSIGQGNRTPLIMGENIGYQTGNFKMRPQQGIIYMTIGTLQQQLNVMSDEEILNKYSLIIIDEVHIRSLGLDFTLFMLKKFIKRNYTNPLCPFIITTSATFDTINMTNYMLSDIPKKKRYNNIIKVSGLSFPIETHFTKIDSDDYHSDAAKKVFEIHTKNEDEIKPLDEFIKSKSDMSLEDAKEFQQFRDILIFIGGANDVKQIETNIRRLLKSNVEYVEKYPIMIIQLSRNDVNNKTRNYYNALNPLSTIVPPVSRRVIIATSIAETGITIDSLKYVIETGYFKSNEYNPIYGITTLITKPVAQSMFKQRKGRVGRKYPGICYAMYTEETYNKLNVNDYPDILKDNITLDILSIIIKEANIPSEIVSISEYIKSSEFYNITKSKIDLNSVDLFEFPAIDTISGSLNKLYTLGAIYNNCTPTKLGLLMNRFRKISVESIRMILSAYALGVSVMDTIIIISFITNKFSSKLTQNFKMYNEFLKNFESKFGYTYLNKLNEIISCDFITCILIFYEFQNQILIESEKIYKKDKILHPSTENLEKWCDKYALDLNVLLNIVETKEEIFKTLTDLQLNPYQNNKNSFDNIDFTQTEDYIKNMKQCIYEGYKMNMLIWNKSTKKYYTSNGKISIEIPRKLFLPNKRKIELYGITPPNYIIYESLFYLQSSMDSEYISIISYISVLDGYINFDKTFEKNINY